MLRSLYFSAVLATALAVLLGATSVATATDYDFTVLGITNAGYGDFDDPILNGNELGVSRILTTAGK